MRLNEQFLALRRLFLMYAGDLMEHFTESLTKRVFEAIAPQKLQSATFLNNLFDFSIKEVGYHKDTYTQKLVFKDCSESCNPIDECPFDELKKIYLHFEMPYPLPVIITQQNLCEYNSVFRFFLRIRRVALEIRSVWKLLQ